MRTIELDRPRRPACRLQAQVRVERPARLARRPGQGHHDAAPQGDQRPGGALRREPAHQRVAMLVAGVVR